MLQQQETLHSVEIQKWQRILKTSIQLLKQVSFDAFSYDVKYFYVEILQTEESLNELQRAINPTYTHKVMSILQNHKDTVEKSHQNEL